VTPGAASWSCQLADNRYGKSRPETYLVRLISEQIFGEAD